MLHELGGGGGGEVVEDTAKSSGTVNKFWFGTLFPIGRQLLKSGAFYIRQENIYFLHYQRLW